MEFGPITRALLRNKTRFALIVLQIAVTLAVVTNAINMIVAERTKMQKQSGFDDDNLLWVRSRPFAPAFSEQAYRIATAQNDIRVLQGIPGVKAVANTNFLPWQGGGSSDEVKVAGGDGSSYRTQVYTTTPGILDTLGIRMVSGRNFTDADVTNDPDQSHYPIIISRALERLIFRGESALGRQFADDDGTTSTIVGVFDEFYNPYGWPIHEYGVFYAGNVSLRGGQFLVRVEPGQMKNVSPMIEKALVKANEGRNVELRTIAEVRRDYFREGRIVIGAMATVIFLIILVTGLGIVGVTSFTVAARTRQIGTRRALGATKPAIIRYFLLENWIVTNSGLVLGVFLAYALNYLMVTQMEGTRLDWRFLAAAMALIWLQGAVATLAPAMRAAAVSPVIATKGA